MLFDMLARTSRLRQAVTIPRRSYRIRRGMRVFDAIDAEWAPRGALSTLGWGSYSPLPPEDVLLLKSSFDDDGVLSVSTERSFAALESATRDFVSDAVEYLGPHVRLEQVALHKAWPSTRAEQSGAWHTDCVGRRLKLYICLDGDGTMPTHVAPASTTRMQGRYGLTQDLRWVGRDALVVDDFTIIRHVTGSRNAFDTDLLHRGVYEESTHPRTAIVFEFSDCRKWPTGAQRKLPIGPSTGPYSPTRISPAFVEDVARLLHLDPRYLFHDKRQDEFMYPHAE